MDIKLAFLCDHAAFTPAKTVDARGVGFSRAYSDGVPCRWPAFWTVLALEFQASEAGDEHNWTLRLTDPDGKEPLRPFRGQFTVDEPKVGIRSTQWILMEAEKVLLEAFGDYSVIVFIDGIEMTRLDFTLAKP